MVLILKFFSLLLSALLLFQPIPAAGSTGPEPEVSALAAVVMDENAHVLYERSAHRMLPIASTTKIMTALVVLERCDTEERVTVPASCCGIEGSSMYLKAGESYTVRELLTGLLLVSGNDAAAALAVHCAGDLPAFSALMNEKARALGMEETHFMNPHGLNEAGHYSTAHDLALLMRAAMANGTYAELSSLRRAEIGGQTLVSHNKLFLRYEACIGGKTGYTKVAGRCLVSCAERDSCRLFCVTLNDPDDWNDHVALYEWAYSRCEERRFDAQSCRCEIPLLSGAVSRAAVIPAVERRVLVPEGADLVVTAELPFYVFAPVARGSPAGRLLLRSGERVLAEIPMIYAEDYPLNW